MNKKDILIVISTLLLVALACDVYLHIGPQNAGTSKPMNKITVVYAVHDIAGGHEIDSDDVDETVILENRLPKEMVSKEEAHSDYHSKKYHPDWYPTTKLDVVGRISKGIEAGQVLFYRYPGFAGMLPQEPN